MIIITLNQGKGPPFSLIGKTNLIIIVFFPDALYLFHYVTIDRVYGKETVNCLWLGKDEKLVHICWCSHTSVGFELQVSSYTVHDDFISNLK